MYVIESVDRRTDRHEELHDSFPKKKESSFRMLRNECGTVMRCDRNFHIQE
jgi:hypothetical protein